MIAWQKFLPPGKTEDEAMHRARARLRDIAQQIWPSQDDMHDALDVFCTSLLGGNTEAGSALASDAFWAGWP